MTALADTIVQLYDDNEPFVFCFPCLASRVSAREKEVRMAVRPLIVSWDWQLAPRMCHGCGEEGEFLERRPSP